VIETQTASDRSPLRLADSKRAAWRARPSFLYGPCHRTRRRRPRRRILALRLVAGRPAGCTGAPRRRRRAAASAATGDGGCAAAVVADLDGVRGGRHPAAAAILWWRCARPQGPGLGTGRSPGPSRRRRRHRLRLLAGPGGPGVPGVAELDTRTANRNLRSRLGLRMGKHEPDGPRPGPARGPGGRRDSARRTRISCTLTGARLDCRCDCCCCYWRVSIRCVHADHDRISDTQACWVQA
jgi:hypothetical protein